MARTKTVSDEEIFAAAKTVYERRGLHNFTISDVAAETGLSRAAIILRFESTQKLKVALMTRLVDGFLLALDALPKTPSGDNLLSVADFIGRHAGNRDSLPTFFSNYAANMDDSELAALERKRGGALHALIYSVMPSTNISRESAATAFGSHLTGTIVNSVVVEDMDARTFIVTRAKEWLRLAGIPFTDDAPDKSSKKAPRKAAVKKAKSKAPRQKGRGK